MKKKGDDPINVLTEAQVAEVQEQNSSERKRVDTRRIGNRKRLTL